MAILVGPKGVGGVRSTIAADLALALEAAEKSTSVPLPDGVLSVAAYRAWFDYNSDNWVNTSDYSAFLARYGHSFSY